MQIETVKEKISDLFECDSIRIPNPGDEFFAIIGKEKNNQDWVDENGDTVNFDYLDETIVARGGTLEELVESAKEYKRYMGMDMMEYLREELDIPESENLQIK